LQIKIKIVSCHAADSKTVKQEVNGTVILPPSVFPGFYISLPKPRSMPFLITFTNSFCFKIQHIIYASLAK
jgi:hypothetical protein